VVLELTCGPVPVTAICAPDAFSAKLPLPTAAGSAIGADQRTDHQDHRRPGHRRTRRPADPPNNNGYERTLRWTNISQAVTALTPFADKTAAGDAGFDTTKPYQFKPFTPRLPEALGAFHSFLG